MKSFLFTLLFFTSAIANAQCDSTFTFSTDTSGYILSFTPQDLFAVSYTWDFGDGNTSSSTEPSNTYADTGAYTVCLTVVTFVQGQQETCSSCQDIVVSNTIGTDSTANILKATDFNYTIYPNPFKENLTVAIDNNNMDLTIQLIDINGRIISNSATNASSKIQIDTSNLEKGICFVKILSPDGTFTTAKVIKQ